MGTETNPVGIQTLERLLDAFNGHDIDAVMSFFADDCILEMPRGPDPWGRRLEGRERVREGLTSRFAGIPDVHYGEDRHWLAGDRGCSGHGCPAYPRFGGVAAISPRHVVRRTTSPGARGGRISP